MRASLLLFLCFLPVLPAAAEIYPVTLFRNYDDVLARPGLIIGKINTKGRDNSIPPRQILGYDARMPIVSASIDNAARIYPGMKIYVVKRERDHQKNKAALIVAEGEIDSISDTVFSGRVAQIRGQFSMVSRQHFIAIPKGEERDAHEYLLEAERYRHEHDFARAAQKLQHAREIEPANPLVNLRYAELALLNGAEEKARAALKLAFAERRRLEDVNEYLKLGSHYLRAEVRALPAQNTEILKTGTMLLTAMRQFEKDLGQFRKDLSARPKFSRFAAAYHVQYGILLKTIGSAMADMTPEGVGKLLDYAGRDALYAPIETRRGRERVLALPRQMWDRAYTEAAITHFEMALRKDRHSEAAFELIDLCDQQWSGADANRREYLKELVVKYAPQYLETGHEDQRMARVRRALNKVNQA